MAFTPNEVTRVVNSLERIEELLTILVQQGGVANATTVETVILQREHSEPSGLSAPYRQPDGFYSPNTGV